MNRGEMITEVAWALDRLSLKNSGRADAQIERYQNLADQPSPVSLQQAAVACETVLALANASLEFEEGQKGETDGDG